MDGYARSARIMVFFIVIAVIMSGIALGYSVLGARGTEESDDPSLRYDEDFRELYEADMDEGLQELLEEYENAMLLKDVDGEISEDVVMADGAKISLSGVEALYLGENTLADTGQGTSGAGLMGVYDEFQNSDSGSVQDVLKDLDEAISSLSGDEYQSAADSVDGGDSDGEVDPVFTASAAFDLTQADVADWDEAFGWGDHSQAGYVEAEADPVWSSAKGNFLRSNANDTYTRDHTLTFLGNADFDGDLTITDQIVMFDASGFVAFQGVGQIRFYAGEDTDNYAYFGTSDDSTGLFWGGYTSNDPGLRINSSSNKLEFRDENEIEWTPLDSFSNSIGISGSSGANLCRNSDLRYGSDNQEPPWWDDDGTYGTLTKVDLAGETPGVHTLVPVNNIFKLAVTGGTGTAIQTLNFSEEERLAAGVSTLSLSVPVWSATEMSVRACLVGTNLGDQCSGYNTTISEWEQLKVENVSLPSNDDAVQIVVEALDGNTVWFGPSMLSLGQTVGNWVPREERYVVKPQMGGYFSGGFPGTPPDYPTVADLTGYTSPLATVVSVFVYEGGGTGTRLFIGHLGQTTAEWYNFGVWGSNQSDTVIIPLSDGQELYYGKTTGGTCDYVYSVNGYWRWE